MPTCSFRLVASHTQLCPQIRHPRQHSWYLEIVHRVMSATYSSMSCLCFYSLRSCINVAKGKMALPGMDTAYKLNGAFWEEISSWRTDLAALSSAVSFLLDMTALERYCLCWKARRGSVHDCDDFLHLSLHIDTHSPSWPAYIGKFCDFYSLKVTQRWHR